MTYLFIFLIKSLINLSQNYVIFGNSSGNWLSDELNSVRFISQCEIWNVCRQTPLVGSTLLNSLCITVDKVLTY